MAEALPVPVGLVSSVRDKGGSSRGHVLRRAGTCAALLVLTALAAAVMMGGGQKSELMQRGDIKSWSRAVIGNTKANSATSAEELSAAEAGSAAAADAAGVLKSEAATAAPSEPAAAAPAGGEAPAEEAAPEGEGEAAAEGGAQGEAAEGEAAPAGEAEAAAPEAEGAGAAGPEMGGVTEVQESAPPGGTDFQAPPGFPFPSGGASNMVERPLNVPSGNTAEFPPGVVYAGPPVVGGQAVAAPGVGRMVVNMAGNPRQGTAVVEHQQVMGMAPGVASAISAAIREDAAPAPAPAEEEAPAAAPAEEEAPAAAPAGQEEGGEGGEADKPTEEEIQKAIADAMGEEAPEGEEAAPEEPAKEAAPEEGGGEEEPAEEETAPEEPAEEETAPEEPAEEEEAAPVVHVVEQAEGATGAWGYGPSGRGPEHWGSLGYPTCSTGLQQSPINVEFDVKAADLPTLAWQIPAGGAGAAPGVSFDGRAVKVAGYDAVFAYGGRSYELRETVVHTPSEHTFGGQHFAMELQFVHAAQVQGVDELLVVSAFVRTHDESNAVLARLSRALGAGGGALGGLAFDEVAMSVLGQMEAVNPTVTNAQNYYQYEGSATAPPCQQGTKWVLLKNSLVITFADLARFTGVQGSNARPVQALGGRTVFDSHAVA